VSGPAGHGYGSIAEPLGIMHALRGLCVRGVHVVLFMVVTVIMVIMVVEVVVVMLTAEPLASTSLVVVVIVRGAEPAPLFLVPGAEGLSAKHEVVVVDDDGRLDPDVCIEVHLVG